MEAAARRAEPSRPPVTPRAYLTARPLSFGYSASQSEGIAWAKAALERAAGPNAGPEAERALRLYDRLDRATAIGRRSSCLSDFVHTDWEAMTLFREGDGRRWHEPPLERRMAVFADAALAVARDAFAADAAPPDALVQVSCTGYDTPTALQRLSVERGWAGTRVLHIGHMGCYACVPALALAADLVAMEAARRPALAPAGDGAPPDAPGATASIFLVEMCTLHHRPATTDAEQVVQQCLFADGAARVDVSTHPAPPGQPGERGFALLDHVEALIPETERAMTWRVADSAFRMTLSREIPQHLQTHLPGLVGGFLARHGLSVADVKWWAVHPGGPRIVESAAEALGLPAAAVAHSQQMLYEHGNMSSATLPHIWAALAADPAVRPGDLVASLAFGPGLTVTGNLMRVGA